MFIIVIRQLLRAFVRMKINRVISLAVFVLCSHLWSVSGQSWQFGLTPDGTKYHRALRCPISNLYHNSWYAQANTKMAAYVPVSRMSCCYAVGSRNDCCRYLERNTAGILNAKCKCKAGVSCDPCPPGSHHYTANNVCIRVLEENNKFSDALTRCQSFPNGKMLEITDVAMMNFVSNAVLGGTALRNIWVGVVRSAGNFEYATSGNPTTYQKFYTGYPTNSDTSDCVKLSLVDTQWYWQNLRCTYSYYALCQQPAA